MCPPSSSLPLGAFEEGSRAATSGVSGEEACAGAGGEGFCGGGWEAAAASEDDAAGEAGATS